MVQTLTDEDDDLKDAAVQDELQIRDLQAEDLFGEHLRTRKGGRDLDDSDDESSHHSQDPSRSPPPQHCRDDHYDY